MDVHPDSLLGRAFAGEKTARAKKEVLLQELGAIQAELREAKALIASVERDTDGGRLAVAMCRVPILERREQEYFVKLHNADERVSDASQQAGALWQAALAIEGRARGGCCRSEYERLEIEKQLLTYTQPV